MDLQYTINPYIEFHEVRDLLFRSIGNRHDEEVKRLIRIVPDANVVVAVRDGKKLVGLARGLKELSGCCYLSDLIVDHDYQDQGIGEKMIRQVRKIVGDKALILLVPAPDAGVHELQMS